MNKKLLMGGVVLAVIGGLVFGFGQMQEEREALEQAAAPAEEPQQQPVSEETELSVIEQEIEETVIEDEDFSDL